MPGSDDVSLAKVLEYAEAAMKHAHAEIKAGSTQISNNLLTEQGRFDALRKGVKQVREVIKQRDFLETLEVSLFEENIEAISKYSLGNCGELALSALDYMLNHVPNVHAEIYRIAGGDHYFLVINRGKNSDATNPKTWGEDAVICDPWTNKVYPAAEYETNLKNYKYDKANKKNITEDLDSTKHELTPITYFATNYLRRRRTIRNLKRGFAEQGRSLSEAVAYYHDSLANEVEELKKNNEDKKVEVILKKMQVLQKIINARRAAIDEMVTSEYKADYRVVRAELVKKFGELKTEAISAMEFSSEDKIILFAERYDALRTQAVLMHPPPDNILFAPLQELGLFGSQSRTMERHLQEITDEVNERLQQLKIKKY